MIWNVCITGHGEVCTCCEPMESRGLNLSDIATSIRLQKHTDILTVYKEYGMIMEEPLVNETDLS